MELVIALEKFGSAPLASWLKSLRGQASKRGLWYIQRTRGSYKTLDPSKEASLSVETKLRIRGRIFASLEVDNPPEVCFGGPAAERSTKR